VRARARTHTQSATVFNEQPTLVNDMVIAQTQNNYTRYFITANISERHGDSTNSK